MSHETVARDVGPTSPRTKYVPGLLKMLQQEAVSSYDKTVAPMSITPYCMAVNGDVVVPSCLFEFDIPPSHLFSPLLEDRIPLELEY